MGRYERIAIVLSVLAAGAGIALSFPFADCTQFSRSGSLITIIAIVFASLDLRERIARASSMADEQLTKVRPVNEQMARGKGLAQDRTDAVVAEIESEIRKDVRDAVRAASKRILLVELSLFVIGTLIWGYGDIFLKVLVSQINSS